MKICTKCKKVKAVEQFSKRADKPDGRSYHCLECHRPVTKRNYQRNRAKYIALTALRNAGYKEEAYRFILEYFKAHPCIDCGESHPVVLQFDHVRGKKMYTISNIANMGGKSLTSLKTEIDKCEVRCANCHSLKTARERDWITLRMYEEGLKKPLSSEAEHSAYIRACGIS